MESATLAKKLAAIEGRQWAEFGKPPKEISPNKLARLLRRFNIAPATIRTGPGEDDTAKGYRLDDFTDAFERFLPKTPILNRHTVTEAVNIGGNELSQPSQPESVLRIENAVSANKYGGCDGVTVQKQETAPAPRKVVIPPPPGWPKGKLTDPALVSKILAAEAAKPDPAEILNL